jgi:hypothetical protein
MAVWDKHGGFSGRRRPRSETTGNMLFLRNILALRILHST